MRKFLVLMFCIILLVGMVSAFDFDNTKSDLIKGKGI